MSSPGKASSEKELSAGDYAFLGFVGRGLDTAYEIKKAMAASISHFWTAAHSQVYSQAARLARDGFVSEREEPGGRRRKRLKLTAKGRRALRAWLGEPAGQHELRDEMLVKVFFAAESDGTTAAVLEDYRQRCERLLSEYEELRQNLEGSGDERVEDALATLRLGIRVTRAYLDWLDETAPRY